MQNIQLRKQAYCMHRNYGIIEIEEILNKWLNFNNLTYKEFKI